MAAESSISTSTRLVPVIPDGGWGWAVVLGSFFIHVIADGFVYSFGVLVEILMQHNVTAIIRSQQNGEQVQTKIFCCLERKYGVIASVWSKCE
ncbi:hypothetical protein ANCDUO_19145 [Ancylostoma duodenale]|uniref:Uncharacterized protein n=1 Tax=Ancylostoma duodenale TaxID=51022 RepID=A0A0C2C3B2_9BILA|nr:hypothetical protein ANCDUO_19145 [Ancylostoma duodenale]